MELLPQISSPFTGREKELGVPLELQRQRKNVLIVGSPGVRKSALVRQVKVRSPLMLFQRPRKWKDLYSSLDSQLHLEQTPLTVSERQDNLLSKIEARGEPVVFDSVSDAPKAVDRTSEALEVIREAQELVERFEGRCCSAELHRLRGVFLTALGAGESQIEASFHEAIRIAKEQKSISLAKRAEASYAEYRNQKTNASTERGFRLPLC